MRRFNKFTLRVEFNTLITNYRLQLAKIENVRATYTVILYIYIYIYNIKFCTHSFKSKFTYCNL